MKYKCTLCDYITNDSSNYERHVKSSKHKKHNSEEDINSNGPEDRPYQCALCNSQYSYGSGLRRHQRTCKMDFIDKMKNEYDDIIKKKDTEIFILSMANKGLEEKLKLLEACLKNNRDDSNKALDLIASENNYHKQLIDTAGNFVKSSVSALTYASQHFPDAPVFERFNKFELLKIEEHYTVAEIVLYQQKNKTLASMMGDIIINHYKKEDPTKQSLWNTDCSRFAYIIREVIDNKVQWTVDKGGVKVHELAVEPILLYVKDQLNDYCLDKADELLDRDKDPIVISEELHKANKLIDIINNGELGKDIIRYMTKSFYLNKQLLKQAEESVAEPIIPVKMIQAKYDNDNSILSDEPTIES